MNEIMLPASLSAPRWLSPRALGTALSLTGAASLIYAKTLALAPTAACALASALVIAHASRATSRGHAALLCVVGALPSALVVAAAAPSSASSVAAFEGTFVVASSVIASQAMVASSSDAAGPAADALDRLVAAAALWLGLSSLAVGSKALLAPALALLAVFVARDAARAGFLRRVLGGAQPGLRLQPPADRAPSTPVLSCTPMHSASLLVDEAEGARAPAPRGASPYRDAPPPGRPLLLVPSTPGAMLRGRAWQLAATVSIGALTLAAARLAGASLTVLGVRL